MQAFLRLDNGVVFALIIMLLLVSFINKQQSQFHVLFESSFNINGIFSTRIVWLKTCSNYHDIDSERKICILLFDNVQTYRMISPLIWLKINYISLEKATEKLTEWVMYDTSKCVQVSCLKLCSYILYET